LCCNTPRQMFPQQRCSLCTGDKTVPCDMTSHVMCTTLAVHLIQLRVDRHHVMTDACRAGRSAQALLLKYARRVQQDPGALSCTVQDDHRLLTASPLLQQLMLCLAANLNLARVCRNLNSWGCKVGCAIPDGMVTTVHISIWDARQCSMPQECDCV